MLTLRVPIKPLTHSVEFDIHLMDVSMMDKITIEGCEKAKECGRLAALEAGIEVEVTDAEYIFGLGQQDITSFRITAQSPINRINFEKKMEAYY